MKKSLVIGGSGFLGTALAGELKRRGEDVRVFDLNRNPDVFSIIGDLREPDGVMRACEGIDTVYHTAALVDWGPRSRQRLVDINVTGTRNVIAACRANGVKRLVYTSSIDVVFDGRPIANGDETLPYPRRHLDDYGATKATAEREVLAANGQDGLLTCAIRTGGIYGPGDRHRFPGILGAYRSGNAMRLGDGTAKFGHVYVLNAAYAHILAAGALVEGSPVARQCYFVDDGAPGNFFDFFEPYLTALGYQPATKSLSHPLALTVATLSEWAARLGIGPQRPLLTRYVVQSTCRDFYFSNEKAKRDFGYRLLVPLDQAYEETRDWLKKSGWGNPAAH